MPPSVELEDETCRPRARSLKVTSDRPSAVEEQAGSSREIRRRESRPNAGGKPPTFPAAPNTERTSPVRDSSTERQRRAEQRDKVAQHGRSVSRTSPSKPAAYKRRVSVRQTRRSRGEHHRACAPGPSWPPSPLASCRRRPRGATPHSSSASSHIARSLRIPHAACRSDPHDA